MIDHSFQVGTAPRAWWETPMGVGVWGKSGKGPSQTLEQGWNLWGSMMAVMRVHERYQWDHGSGILNAVLKKCSTLAPFPGPGLLAMVTSLTSDADSMQQKWKTWSCHLGVYVIAFSWHDPILLPIASSCLRHPKTKVCYEKIYPHASRVHRIYRIWKILTLQVAELVQQTA